MPIVGARPLTPVPILSTKIAQKMIFEVTLGGHFLVPIVGARPLTPVSILSIKIAQNMIFAVT